MSLYEVRPSTYIRGVAIVEPLDMPTDAPAQTRTTRLCAAFSQGKYSPRERGYRMDSVTLHCFTRALRLGCDSDDGKTIKWRSPDGKLSHHFSARHPKKALCQINQKT